MEERKPKYCRECKKAGTFEREPERDYRTESGKVFLKAYRCQGCGKISLMTAQPATDREREALPF